MKGKAKHWIRGRPQSRSVLAIEVVNPSKKRKQWTEQQMTSVMKPLKFKELHVNTRVIL